MESAHLDLLAMFARRNEQVAIFPTTMVATEPEERDARKIMNRADLLAFVIRHELFVVCPLLDADQFVSFCCERGVAVDSGRLERLERLRLFFPIARVRLPKLKMKVEYTPDRKSVRHLGQLKEREQWTGETKDVYADFSFHRADTELYLSDKLLWEPTSRDFQPWSTFIDKDYRPCVESYYSHFQAYELYMLLQALNVSVHVESYADSEEKSLLASARRLAEYAQARTRTRTGAADGAVSVSLLCQVLSNRYFPSTQTDGRSISLSFDGTYREWDWNEYRKAWNAEANLSDVGVSITQVEQMHKAVAVHARSVDPLENWYRLVRFISVEKKKRLKGPALLAQLFYSMEKMLRLFIQDLTGKTLLEPDESKDWPRDRFYGAGVSDDTLMFMECVANEYGVNPRPRMILVVEGDGEEAQIPRLVREVFGYSLSKMGIEILNLRGVGNFVGGKRIDKFGALERLIDDYQSRQTFVFCILDREDRVETIRRRLIEKPSRSGRRRVTSGDLIHLWTKCIEFDNFTSGEIAAAMTTLAGSAIVFEASDVEACIQGHDHKKGTSIEALFESRTSHGLSKTDLLRELFDVLVKEADHAPEDFSKRPIAIVIQRMLKLAARNHFPARREDWAKNQSSGLLGDPTGH